MPHGWCAKKLQVLLGAVGPAGAKVFAAPAGRPPLVHQNSQSALRARGHFDPYQPVPKSPQESSPQEWSLVCTERDLAPHEAGKVPNSHSALGMDRWVLRFGRWVWATTPSSARGVQYSWMPGILVQPVHFSWQDLQGMWNTLKFMAV